MKSPKPTLSKKDKQGLMIAGAASFVIGLLVLAPFLVGDGRTYDQETFCPEGIPHNQTVLLIDKTDRFTSTQVQFLRNYLTELRDTMKQYEELKVFVLNSANYMRPTAVLNTCKPQTGEDANPFYENPRKIADKWRSQFGEPMEETINFVVENETADRSPILEMIREVIYTGPFSDDAPKKRLIIVSDFLQYTEQLSHYHVDPDYEAFLKSPYAAQVGVKIPQGVEVKMIYLIRSIEKVRKHQTTAHATFWTKYFRDIGGAVDRPIYVN